MGNEAGDEFVGRSLGQLDNKTAIITGAAQGMGASHARRFIEEGAKVVLTDLQVEVGQELVKELGDRAVFARRDITSEADWDAVIATATERFGRLDALVNNAAIYHTASIEDETAEGLRSLFEVNVVGTWWGIKKAIAPMKEAGGGSIVNISSIAGTRGIPAHCSYGASKWAVRGLTKVAAAELGPFNIRVNSVHPGGIAGTGMFAISPEDPVLEKVNRGIPLRRSGEVHEVSGLVVYLVSDASTYITGNEHVIDGGSTV